MWDTVKYVGKVADKVKVIKQMILILTFFSF